MGNSNRLFPIETFVSLYICQHRALYINYMQGAKLLAAWLGPMGLPPATADIPEYPLELGNYSIQQLIAVLSPNAMRDAKIYKRYHNYIVHRLILSCQTPPAAQI